MGVEAEEELIPGLPDEIARECLIRIPYKRFSTVGAVCNRWKEEIHSSELHRLRRLSGTTRSVVALALAEPAPTQAPLKHLSAPSYRLCLYEPDSGSWDPLPPIPDVRLPLFCQVAVAGRNLVVVGGWDPATWAVSDRVYVYNFLSATWRSGAGMPGPHRSFFACASDTKSTVYVAGGHDGEKNALASALAYDVAKDVWVPLPDMATERDECKGIFHRGRFHVIGGYCTTNQGRFESSAEAFDVDTWRWGPVEEGALETGTCPRTCVVGHDDRLYRCRSGHVVVKEGATWRAVAELPVDARVAPYMLTWKDKLMVIGSETHGGPRSVYVLDVVADRKRWPWKKMESHVGHVQVACCFEI